MSPDSAAPAIDVAALGKQLKARRESLNRAQDDLAIAIGISRVQLQNIESGLSDRAKRTPANPRLSTLVALCSELGGRLIIDVTAPGGVVIEFDQIHRT